MAMNDEYIAKMKYLNLKGLMEHWKLYIKYASDKKMSYENLLKYIIDNEYEIKKENARQYRIKRAHIPEKYVIETFPFHLQPKLNRNKTIELYDNLEYINKHENIIWIGPTGCGKTGLATSFMINAINKGYKGYFVTFADLINEIYKSMADHSQMEIAKKYLSYDVLLLDEIGYIETEPAQVGLFFNLMQKRHRKKTTLITTNLGFSEWGTFLKNPHLTSALIDRLTETSHLINMIKCDTIRETLDKKLHIQSNTKNGK
jgi:DNA replication protein DnaC